jgi:DNA-binding NarL/FixJ family response regulator
MYDAVGPLLARYGQRDKRQLEGIVEPALTERQRQVLRLLIQGASNCEIATALGMGEKTVRNLLSEVYQLLNVRTRTEAVLYALQRGWLGKP